MEEDLFETAFNKQNEEALDYLNEIFPEYTKESNIKDKKKLFISEKSNNQIASLANNSNNIQTKNENSKNIYSLNSNIINNINNAQKTDNGEKKEQLVKVMKEYEYRINKHTDLQLSSLGHEKKLKKLVLLKNTLFKKFSQKRKEVNLMLTFQDTIKNKEIYQNEDNLDNDTKKIKNSTNFLNKYKSIYKRISNKQRFKIELRYKKIRELYIRRKKVQKQLKKKQKNVKNFLHYNNYGNVDFGKLIMNIEQNDWRAFIEKKAFYILDNK